MAFLRKLLQPVCVACALSFLLLIQPGVASAEPQNGWWLNPNENGRGFFFERRDGMVYFAGYLYESDGRATWLSSGGPMPDPNFYQGPLQTYRNGKSIFGAYRGPDPAVDVGEVTLRFTDDTHGTVTWPGGTVPIERFTFGTGQSTFQPETGWWWSPGQGGTGYSVEVQGSTAFVVAFLYDGAGDPVWYFTAGPMTTPTHFEADWLEFSGGQTLTGAYRAPGAPRNLGRVAIDFTHSQAATITFTEGASVQVSSKAGRSTSSELVPLFPPPLPPVYPVPLPPFVPPNPSGYTYAAQWPQWIGTVRISGEERSDNAFTRSIFQWNLIWVLKPQASATRFFYELAPQSTFTYSFQFNDFDVPCVKTANHSVPLTIGELEVREDATYAMSMGERSLIAVPYTANTCDDYAGTMLSTFFELGQDEVTSSVINGMYPAYNYALGRTQPTMIGLHPSSDPYRIEWSFTAYP